jgi:hypothetical protein
MAKRSVAYKSDRGQIPNTADYKGDFQGSTQPKSKLSGGFGPFGIKYSKPIGPVKPVGLRMDEYSRQQLAKLKQPAAPVPKAKPKPAQVIRTTVSERITPVKAAAPARMAVNRATGDTTGFTTGKTTGSTVTKSGTAYKTPTTSLQRMGQNAFNKGGVAGPSKSSASRSTGGASRSTGGASRSTGGRISDPSRGGMGNSGRGTGSKK